MKIIQFLTILTISILLSACGGGGDTTIGSKDTIDPTQETIQTIKIIDCKNTNQGLNNCGDASTLNYYTCIEANDEIISLNNSTQLEIIDISNGIKKVCIKETTPSGEANILRDN